MLKYSDAHNHITTKVPISSIYNTYKLEDISNISATFNNNRAIGLHPMFLPKAVNWDNIEQMLISNGKLMIGEVGLDKRSKDTKSQVEYFNKFLNLAIKHNRAVTIHCVKAWGEVLNSLNRHFNDEVPVLFHGYSGSRETYKQLLGVNSYFSFSLREVGNPRINDIIKSVPIDKLLIESDMLFEDYISLGSNRYLDQIKQTFKQVSSIKGIPLDNLTNSIQSNFNRFIQES